MSNQATHLVFVAIIFALMIGIVGVVLRHYYPRRWLIYLTFAVTLPIILPLAIGFIAQ